MSPELLDPTRFGLKKSRLTKESDCYALGMVVYETLSGQKPFARDPLTVVILKVLDGNRPGRPQGARGVWFTDSIWGVLDLCWKPQPGERPSLDAVLQCLQGASQPSRPPSPMDEDMETNTGSQLDVTTTNDSSMFPPLGLMSQAHLQPKSDNIQCGWTLVCFHTPLQP